MGRSLSVHVNGVREGAVPSMCVEQTIAKTQNVPGPNGRPILVPIQYYTIFYSRRFGSVVVVVLH